MWASAAAAAEAPIARSHQVRVLPYMWVWLLQVVICGAALASPGGPSALGSTDCSGTTGCDCTVSLTTASVTALSPGFRTSMRARLHPGGSTQSTAGLRKYVINVYWVAALERRLFRHDMTGVSCTQLLDERTNRLHIRHS